EAFHASVELYRAPDTLPRETLRQRVQRRLSEEQELVVAPDFFRALPQRLSGIGGIEIVLKRGRARNELVLFRSDVALCLTGEHRPVEPAWHDWEAEALTLRRLREWLEAGPDILAVRQIPNARVTRELKTVELVHGDAAPATVGDLRKR